MQIIVIFENGSTCIRLRGNYLSCLAVTFTKILAYQGLQMEFDFRMLYGFGLNVRNKLQHDFREKRSCEARH